MMLSAAADRRRAPRHDFRSPSSPFRARCATSSSLRSSAAEKTTTTGLHEEYLREGKALEQPGSRSLVVDSDGRPVAVIETIEVELRRFADVDLQFAIDEGEGFETVQAWREAHARFFTSPEMVGVLGDPPVVIDDDTTVVCETFRLAEIVGRSE